MKRGDTVTRTPPSREEIERARASHAALERIEGRNARFVIALAGQEETTIELPEHAVLLLKDVLEALAAGKGVTVIPESAELTSVQAAAVLNVSRPFLVKLLDAGVIKHRRVGSHRRIRLEDVLAYRDRVDGDRDQTLTELTQMGQDDGLGYPKS